MREIVGKYGTTPLHLWRSSHHPNIKHPINGPNDVEIPNKKPWFQTGSLILGGRVCSNVPRIEMYHTNLISIPMNTIYCNFILGIPGAPFCSDVAVELAIYTCHAMPRGNMCRKAPYFMLVGGLEHFLFSPIVGMMIQSDFHIFQGGRYTTN